MKVKDKPTSFKISFEIIYSKSYIKTFLANNVTSNWL